MTNWDDIARKREKEAVGADTLLQRLFLRFQTEVWPEIDLLLSGIAVDRVGKMSFTLENIRKAGRVSLVIRSVWQRKSRGIIFDFLLKSFRKLFGLSTDYAKEMGNVTKAAEQRTFGRLLEFYGYKEGKVLPGTLFAALDPSGALSADIARRVQGALASGQKLEDFRRQFRAEFLNPKSGFAARYYRRWTNDLFMQFDRGVSLAYADELGLQHGIYAGTMKDNTRDFCERRLNRVYRRETIAGWNAAQWKGKNQILPVELACGGYNCRHTLNYISPELAAVIGPQRGGIDTYAEL